MRLFTVRVRYLTVFFIFAGFLPASKPCFFNASDKGIPLILSLATPRAVDATAFPIIGNNGNKPLAKRLNSSPTPYPLYIIVPE